MLISGRQIFAKGKLKVFIMIKVKIKDILISAKIVLNKNWSVKTPWQEYMGVSGHEFSFEEMLVQYLNRIISVQRHPFPRLL